MATDEDEVGELEAVSEGATLRVVAVEEVGAIITGAEDPESILGVTVNFEPSEVTLTVPLTSVR